MKSFKMAVAAGLAAAGLVWTAAGHEGVPIDGASGGAEQVTLTWQTDPNAMYRVLETADLAGTNGWSQAGGYLSADGWTLEHMLETTNRTAFFRVEKIDTEGPSFRFLSPAQDAVSVDPGAEVSVEISDPSGVDEGTVYLYVGDDPHGIGDEGVAWDGRVLAWTGGLGGAGEEVEVWATAYDSLGNAASSESSRLVLASEPVEVEDAGIRVIGGGSAPASSTAANAAAAAEVAAAAAARGARDAGAPDEVWIVDVLDGALVFGYTGAVPLAEGQLWASRDPSRIFYRRIASWTEPEPGRLVAETEEATLADFFRGGSFSTEDEGWSEYDVVDLGEGEEPGPLSRRRLVRPRIGGSTAKHFATNGVLKSDWLQAKIDAAHLPLEVVGTLGEWDVGAGFGVGADFSVLKRKFNTCDLSVTGKVHVYLHPKIVTTAEAAYSNTWKKTVADVKKTFGGMIGPVPVWVDVGVEVPVALTVQAQATNASVAAEIDISRSLDFRWRLSDDQWRQLGNGNPGWVVAKTNFTYEVEGSAGVRASIQPTLTVKVYSLVGAYGWVEPYLEANAVGRVQGQNLHAPDFYYLLTAYAGLNAEIGLASTIWCDDWGTPPHKTFSPLRKELLHLEGTNTPPSFVSRPQDYVAENGETVMLSALAKGTPPLRYEWFHDGVDTGRRGEVLTLAAGEATAGNYMVRVRNGYGTNSAAATLSLATNTPGASVVGTWKFRWQWDGREPNACAARIYSDGSMHDTSPRDYWWDWHVNGRTVRFETRLKWNGQSAVYRGKFAEGTGTYMSGTMTSPLGESGKWSMNFFDANPDAPVSGMRALLGAAGEEAPPAGVLPALDPAGAEW